MPVASPLQASGYPLLSSRADSYGKRTGKPSCTTKPDATYAAATLQSHLLAA